MIRHIKWIVIKDGAIFDVTDQRSVNHAIVNYSLKVGIEKSVLSNKGNATK